MNLILIYFAIKYKGYFHDIFNALKNKEYVPIDEIDKIEKMVNSNEICAITIVDDDYPNSLKLINNPPFVLFYKGNKKLLEEEIILFTGETQNEEINKFTTNSINEISKQHAIISNCIKGFEENIVENMLNTKRKIILTSPNGILNPYIAIKIDDSIFKINKNVLLISEYPINSNINKRRLIERNRITVGLSKFMIIASSNKFSYISSFVSIALEQGKDIFCFPGTQQENDGNNLLIQDGAKMITSIKELR